MAIPFRDAEDIEALGAAAFLKISIGDDGKEFRGALFLINARGEPLEFTYSRVEVPSTFLWRRDDVRKHAARTLTVSLLSTCPRMPKFILCPADEVDHELFTHEINLSIPVCRLGSIMKATAHSDLEAMAALETPEPMHVFWFPRKPADDSPEQALMDRLIQAGLLLEPFERAGRGLTEVFSSLGPGNPSQAKE